MSSIREIVAWNNSAVKKRKEDLFKFDFVYYDSFYEGGVDFLRIFANSGINERQDFKSYIVETVANLKDKGAACSRHNILSKKYVNGGNCTQTSLIENAWLLYVTNAVLKADNITSFKGFVNVILATYGELFDIDDSKLREFIFNANGNMSALRVVYCKLYGIRPPLKDVAKDLSQEEIEEYASIDPTDEEGYAQHEALTSSLKKLARQLADHKCECESVENCRYFVAKSSNQTYLEIHHLIPEEFENDCDSSIQILGNYVALCPNCHRKIHYAIDDARRHLITLLFNKRSDKLPTSDMKKIDLNKLFQYYKIEGNA